MKKTVLKVVALMLVAVVFCTALVSCGKKLSGTYEANLIAAEVSYKFSGSKVTVTIDPIIGDDTVLEGKYEIEDDKITFTWEGENADKAEDYSGTLSFAEGEDYITIGGVKYNKADK